MSDGEQLEFGMTGSIEVDMCFTERWCWGCRDISDEDVRDTEVGCLVVGNIADFEFRYYSMRGV